MTSVLIPHQISSFFFFNDTATTEIYTLSLHDALPILAIRCTQGSTCACSPSGTGRRTYLCRSRYRSEEHTSELQSQSNLVCRLLLEKKKNKSDSHSISSSSERSAPSCTYSMACCELRL